MSPMLPVVAILFLAMKAADAAAGGSDWNYKPGDAHGAENWHINYEDCGGVMQSPIDIKTNQIVYDANLQDFDLSDYSITDKVHMSLENVGGHTAEVIVSGRDQYVKGGSLPDDYRLVQFHFHWGINETRGSEHSLNGRFAPMEIHLVHTQRRFPNTTIASTKPFGLAVIGLFFKIGKANANFDTLVQHLDEITNAGDEVDIPTFNIRNLLPQGNLHYYRYSGSLTTPPCSETAIWSIIDEQIEISKEQLDKFRGLFDADHNQLVNDYRPIQSINRRTVTTNKKSAAPNCDN